MYLILKVQLRGLTPSHLCWRAKATSSALLHQSGTHRSLPRVGTPRGEYHGKRVLRHRNGSTAATYHTCSFFCQCLRQRFVSIFTLPSSICSPRAVVTVFTAVLLRYQGYKYDVRNSEMLPSLSHVCFQYDGLDKFQQRPSSLL